MRGREHDGERGPDAGAGCALGEGRDGEHLTRIRRSSLPADAMIEAARAATHVRLGGNGSGASVKPTVSGKESP